LNANASLNASALVSKLAASSLTGAGTLAAELTVTGSATLLLDLYPNAAAAYSLRKLRTAYAGSAIQVRRSSDDTVQDIGFNSNGDLDELSLLLFCGVGNGFVTTWYDQTIGANNLTQSVAINQPQIVSSGSVIKTLGNKPTCRFSGNQWIFKNWTFTLTQPYTNISVNRFVGLGPSIFPYIMRNEFGNDANLSLMGYLPAAGGLRINYGNNLASSVAINFNTNYLWFAIPNGALSRLSINNVTNTGNAGSNNLTNGVALGTYSAITGQFNGFISEQIIYSGSKVTDQTDIQNNINTYYAIY
jgi:hypothetical protein